MGFNSGFKGLKNQAKITDILHEEFCEPEFRLRLATLLFHN